MVTIDIFRDVNLVDLHTCKQSMARPQEAATRECVNNKNLPTERGGKKQL